MRRAFVFLITALAALAAAGPTAGATRPRHGVLIEAKAAGFLVQVQVRLGSEQVRLRLARHGEVAYYYVHGQLGADSVRARFGRLGSLDLSFAPGRGESGAACGEGEEGWQRGTFRGSLAFRGEHDYARLELRRMSGWLQTYPPECGKSRPARGTSKAAARASVAAAAETGVLLEAFTGYQAPIDYIYCSIENETGGVRADFNAFREEKREGMAIFRGAQVRGGTASFRWDLGTGRARLEPPAPFVGRAFYRREGRDKASWRGSLRVPLLGARRPMRLTGAAFHAHLGRDT